MINAIKDFTKEEKDRISTSANFAIVESELFNLRSKGYTLEQCAEVMNISTRTCSRINKRINTKLVKLHILCDEKNP